MAILIGLILGILAWHFPVYAIYGLTGTTILCMVVFTHDATKRAEANKEQK